MFTFSVSKNLQTSFKVDSISFSSQIFPFRHLNPNAMYVYTRRGWYVFYVTSILHIYPYMDRNKCKYTSDSKDIHMCLMFILKFKNILFNIYMFCNIIESSCNIVYSIFD